MKLPFLFVKLKSKLFSPLLNKITLLFKSLIYKIKRTFFYLITFVKIAFIEWKKDPKKMTVAYLVGTINHAIPFIITIFIATQITFPFLKKTFTQEKDDTPKLRVEYAYPTMNATEFPVDGELIIQLDQSTLTFEEKFFTSADELTQLNGIKLESVATGRDIETEIIHKENGIYSIKPTQNLTEDNEYILKLSEDSFSNPVQIPFRTTGKQDKVTTYPEYDRNGNIVLYEPVSVYFSTKYEIELFKSLPMNEWIELNSNPESPQFIKLSTYEYKPSIQILSESAFKIHWFELPNQSISIDINFDHELLSGEKEYRARDTFYINYEVEGVITNESTKYPITVLHSNDEVIEGERTSLLLFLSEKSDTKIINSNSFYLQQSDGKKSNIDLEYKIEKIDKNTAVSKYSIKNNVLEGNSFVWLVTLTPKTEWTTDNKTLYFVYTNEHNDTKTLFTDYVYPNRRIKPSYQCNDKYINGSSNATCVTNEAYFYIYLNQQDQSGKFAELVSIRRTDNQKTQNDALILDKNQYITVQTNKLERDVDYEIIISKGLKGEYNTSTENYIIKLKVSREGIAKKPYITLFTTSSGYYDDLEINYYGKSDNVKIGWKAYDIEKVNITLNKCNDTNACFESISKTEHLKNYSEVASQEYQYPNKDVGPMYRITDFGKLAPGIYELVSTCTSDGEQNEYSREYILVSDVNMVVRASGAQMYSFLMNNETGAPIADQSIYCSVNKQALKEYKTNKDGIILEITSKDEIEKISEYACWSNTSNGPVYVSNYMKRLDWNYSSSVSEKLTGMIVTDREAYNGSDTISYKVILRNRDGSMVDYKNLTVEAYLSADHTDLSNYKTSGEVSEYGTSGGSFSINNIAGYITVNANVKDSNNNTIYSTSKNIYITKVNLTAFSLKTLYNKDKFAPAENVTLTTSVESFSGALDSYTGNVKVVLYRDWYYSDEKYGWYDSQGSWDDSNEEIIIYNGKLNFDANGVANIKFKLPEASKIIDPYRIVAEVSVTDRAGTQVYDYAYSVVYPKIMIWTSEEKTIFTNSALKAIANQPTTATITKTETQYFYEKVDNALVLRTNTKEIERNVVNTTTNSNGEIILLPEWFKASGYYNINFEILGTNVSRSYWNGSDYYNDYYYEDRKPTVESVYQSALYENNQLYFNTNVAEAFVGETVTITGELPTGGYTGYMAVERDGKVIEIEKVSFASPQVNKQIKLKDSYFPNVYIHFYMFGAQQTTGQAVSTTYVSTVNLRVKKDSQLNINIKKDKEIYRPKESVTLQISNSEKKEAEYAVFVVDKAVLTLMERKQLSFYEELFGEQKYDNLFSSIDTVQHQMDRINNEIMDILTDKVKETKGGGSKGGDWSKKDLSVLRRKFEYVAFTDLYVKTDENGNASVSFTLPDSITTWDVYVVATGKDLYWGEKNTDFISKYDVFIQNKTPNALYTNDKFDIVSLIYNTTNQSKTVTVDHLESNCVTQQAENVTIPSGSYVVVSNVSINAPSEPDECSLKIRVADDKNTYDAIEKDIAIFDSKTRVTNSISGRFENKKVETTEIEYKLPEEAVGKEVGFNITVGKDIRVLIPSKLSYIYSYRYLCTEQASSQLKTLLIDKWTNRIDDNKFNTQLEKLLQVIYSHQNVDGGWGIWEQSNSDINTSIIAYTTLLRTKNAGYEVDEEILKQGREYINKQLEKKDTYVSTYILAQLAFEGESLKAYESQINNFNFTRKDSIYYLNYLARIYYSLSTDSSLTKSTRDAYKTKLDKVIAIIEGKSIRDDNGLYITSIDSSYYYYQSTFDPTVETLKTLVLIKYDTNKILQYIDWIEANPNYSTYSNITLAEALISFSSSNKAEISKVLVNGVECKAKDSNEMYVTYYCSVNESKADSYKIAIEGKGTIYYGIYSEYMLTFDEVKTTLSGNIVDKEYYALNGKLITDNQFALGGQYEARTVLISNKQYRELLLSDGVPAGFEVVDYSLDTTAKKDIYERRWYYDYWYDYYWSPYTISDLFIYNNRVQAYMNNYNRNITVYSYDIRAIATGEFSFEPTFAETMYGTEVNAVKRSESVIIE